MARIGQRPYKKRSQDVVPDIPSSPQCSDDTEQYIPDWLDPVVSLLNCSSAGTTYYNEENDFTIVIPEGAIPVGEVITIDIGVALFCPFEYPADVRPVSPSFWLFVREDETYNFVKPLEVKIEHCISICDENDIKRFGLQFMKASSSMHGSKYALCSTAESQFFSTSSTHGTLIDYFHSVCICANTSANSTEHVEYSLSAAYEPLRTNGCFHTVQFITTLSLKYSITKLLKQYNCTVESSKKFFFDYESDEVSLHMKYFAPMMNTWQVVWKSEQKVSHNCHKESILMSV